MQLFVLPTPLLFPRLRSLLRLTAARFHSRCLLSFKKNVFNKYERDGISFNHHRLWWPVTSFPSSDCKRGLVPLL